MIIKRIEVKGSGKKSAYVDLELGLNVIAGASDTGKSYITECIQFVFGKESPPKPIDQARGYTHLEVTFEVDNEGFKLSRELKEKSDITYINSSDSTSIILKPIHKGASNLSSFLLDKFDMNDKVLVKGTESLNHAALTLRIFERILLVDEERIITKNSPIGTGQNTEKTLERSFLKTLLTGKDDSSVLDTKENRNSKSSLKQKMDSLEQFLSQFFPLESDVKETLEQLDEILEGLESSYERAEDELSALISENKTLIADRAKYQEKANNINQSIIDDSLLISRFKLLEKKYFSDRERLEANSEAATYIERHKIANCPVCGNEFDQEQEDIDVDLIVQGNSSEIHKIDHHLFDLRSTLKNTEDTIKTQKEELQSIMSEISRLDSLLNEEVGSKLRQNREILRQLDFARAKFGKKRDQERKRQEILTEIGRLKVDHDKLSDSYEIDDFSKELNQLSAQISEILVRWDFPSANSIKFDLDNRDIEIGGKPRNHFGKGYRAICLSAVILGLMEYLTPKGRHPGFAVLDSPLTTYRTRDEDISTVDDEVILANNLIYAFYRDLCDYYKDKQIIVLDNQEPEESLHGAMNYIHFTGNKRIGRFGFFPTM